MKPRRIVSVVTLIGVALVLMIWLRLRSSTQQHPPTKSMASGQKVPVTPLPASDWLGAASAEERDSILEAVLHDLCHTNPLPRRVTHIHKTYFVGIGESHDPSTNLLGRLSELQCRFQPISSGRGTKFAFYDELTDQVGEAKFLRHITKISPDEAQVEVAAPQHGTPFSGWTTRIVYRVIRKGDRWVATGGDLVN